MNAHDVAAYILTKGQLTAMKLQKLLYYSQAWSLVWDERPLFPERIEAWVNGPVVADLYECHRGKFLLEDWALGNPNNLDELAIETIDSVINYYKGYTAQQLSDLTHREDPWRDARLGLHDAERGNNEITHASMHEYYSGLQDSGKREVSCD